MFWAADFEYDEEKPFWKKYNKSIQKIYPSQGTMDLYFVQALYVVLIRQEPLLQKLNIKLLNINFKDINCYLIATLPRGYESETGLSLIAKNC